jgi:SpoVK/Ycf46/Vps4 family AAA+-type ATPase
MSRFIHPLADAPAGANGYPSHAVQRTETDIDLNLAHLDAELSAVDVLLRRAVQKWRAAGQHNDDPLRGLHLSPEQASQLASRPVNFGWGDVSALTDETELAYADAFNRARNAATAVIEQAIQMQQPLQLVFLSEAFNLSRFEIDVLLFCVAPAVDARFGSLYGFLQDDVTRRHATPGLIIDLLSEPGLQRMNLLAYFTPDSSLIKHGLLQRVPDAHQQVAPYALHQMHRVDETIVAFLFGQYQPRESLAGCLKLDWPQADPADAVVLGESITALSAIADVSVDNSPIVSLQGTDVSQLQAAERHISVSSGMPLLRLELEKVNGGREAQVEAVQAALRDARLSSAVLSVVGWDAILTDGAPPASLMEDVFTHPGPVILTGKSRWQARAVARERSIVWHAFTPPDYTQRVALWQHFVRAPKAVLKQIDFETLAGQFALTATQIRDAAAAANDYAAQHKQKLNQAILLAATRDQSSPALGSLARKITPRHAWNDLVLPDDQREMLVELVNTVRKRAIVLDAWELGRKLTASQGMTALFAGPPGTGKTTGAEIVAAELGLDLYKIDLSTIVSKFIGETEKNLERIFNEAESSNAILFFDEADAIFGKRSEVKDAHDRYANMEVSYLLQRMEAYNGVTILATNLRTNLDDAFLRRLQFAVDFPFPDEQQRLKIWQTLFPSNVERDKNVDFARLAHRFKLTGGSIRNIIVGAAFLAAGDGGVVTQKHLLHSTRRELQKMGRLVNDRDMTV